MPSAVSFYLCLSTTFFVLIFNYQEFNTAAEEAQKLTVKPSNDDLLKLYALFKQATVGDNTTCKFFVYIERIFLLLMITKTIMYIAKPTFDIKGRYKWDAWTAVKGKHIRI